MEQMLDQKTYLRKLQQGNKNGSYSVAVPLKWVQEAGLERHSEVAMSILELEQHTTPVLMLRKAEVL